MADTEMQRGQLTPEQAKLVKEFSAIHRRQWEAMLTTMRQMGEAIGEALRQAGAAVRPPAGESAEGNAVRILVDALDRIGTRIHRDVDPESSYMDVGALDQLAPVLTNFTAYADEQLRALDHPAVLAALAEKQPVELTTLWSVRLPGSRFPVGTTRDEAKARQVLAEWRAERQEAGATGPEPELIRRLVSEWVPADASTPEEHDRMEAGR